MDWSAAIETNREALKRVLAMLVAMAGIAGDVRPATLPRQLHRFLLRLLRPAEAATRRLIIVAARGLTVEPRPRGTVPSGPHKAASIFVKDGVGTGIVTPSAPAPRHSRSLPLFDPLPRWSVRRLAKQAGVPRISLFDWPRDPDPLLPSPDDPLDASRIHRRLEALAAALDDLPRQARRFACWRDAVDHEHETSGAQKHRRIWPLRPGRPPGSLRRPVHEVHDILDRVHGLAFWALERPDTS
jgi:hypothetical protein